MPTRLPPTLFEYVRVVTPSLSEALISRHARVRLHRVARQVPLSDLGGFECRLGRDRSRMDLIVRLPTIGFDVPVARAHDPVWRRIRALSTGLRDQTLAQFQSVNV